MHTLHCTVYLGQLNRLDVAIITHSSVIATIERAFWQDEKQNGEAISSFRFIVDDEQETWGKQSSLTAVQYYERQDGELHMVKKEEGMGKYS